jgi:hypothetical protein
MYPSSQSQSHLSINAIANRFFFKFNLIKRTSFKYHNSFRCFVFIISCWFDFFFHSRWGFKFQFVPDPIRASDKQFRVSRFTEGYVLSGILWVCARNCRFGTSKKPSHNYACLQIFSRTHTHSILLHRIVWTCTRFAQDRFQDGCG